MFFDHGNQGGAVVGIALVLLGVPEWVVWTGFALAWIRTAWPDIAPVFLRDAWGFSFRREDWAVYVRVGFVYSWSEYARLHFPPNGSTWLDRYDPFLNFHRIVDGPAHSVRAQVDAAYRTRVYILTAMSGWVGIAGLLWIM